MASKVCHSTKLALLLWALHARVAAAAQAGDSDGTAGCPASAPTCTKGTMYLQRARRIQKVTALAPLLEVNASADDTRPCCAAFSSWPNVDRGVTCGGCRALVETGPFDGRCDKYCESFGHVCIAAAEERRENCEELYASRCDSPIRGTSDMLCTCVRPDARSCSPTSRRRIEVQGRQLLVDGKPLHLKGVAWNPVPRGSRHVDFKAYVERDAELMKAAGINAVRTYSPIEDRGVLDALWARGIWVVESVYNSASESRSYVAGRVAAVKDHPAILMWTVGNEWNYNGLYTHLNHDRAMKRVAEVVSIIKSQDTEHPVASIYGEIPDRGTINALPDVDIWGVNIYQGLGFGQDWDTYHRRSSKPLFIAEYGADAYNAHQRSEDQRSQAKATTVLTEQIVAHSAVTGGMCIGGFIFEFADEWWKDSKGSRSEHDVGGIAPGGGPYPDQTFNEEWWGLTDIDRKPRLAYDAYANVAVPVSS